MHEQPQKSTLEAAVSRGLATLALLKTNFDEGHDRSHRFPGCGERSWIFEELVRRFNEENNEEAGEPGPRVTP